MSLFANLYAEPLTASAYAPYGRVVSTERDDVPAKLANQGTALRRDWLVELENRRPDAKLNVVAFRCEPERVLPKSLSLLEKHAHSTQLFVPMTARRYLVVVALGGDAPDLATARAFVAAANQAVSYAPGVWHHPMIGLDAPIDFACFVWEDGSAGDCTVFELSSAEVVVHVPPVDAKT